MNTITKAQKARLGVFVLSSVLLFLLTLGTLLGLQLLEKRDRYTILFEESISGLEAGSPVKYNGVRVGNVERFRIPKDNVAGVEVSVSLDAGTPIKADTIAVLNLQGITGLKFVELTGGTDASAALPPGGSIPSAGSTMDVLQTKATSIATKIEQLLDNLVVATGGEDGGRLPEIMDEFHGLLTSTRTLLEDNSDNIGATISNVREASSSLVTVLETAPSLVEETTAAVKHLRTSLEKARIAALLKHLEGAARNAEARLGKKEMGATIASIHTLTQDSSRLVKTADATLLRAREDLLSAIDELVVGIEYFSEFAAILRDNPSALIGGGQKQQRNLP